MMHQVLRTRRTAPAVAGQLERIRRDFPSPPPVSRHQACSRLRLFTNQSVQAETGKGKCPGTKISGGKVLDAASKRCRNRATQAFKLAAVALRSSRSALGAYDRRMCARMDKAKAVTAAAHKLARMVYLLLTRGQEYVDQGQQYYEERYRERVVRGLAKKAADLGMQLVPAVAPA